MAKKLPNFLTLDIHPDHDFYVELKKGTMSNVSMKSEVQLSEFIRYCLEHPELRFWQALRNWSEADSIQYFKIIDDVTSKMSDTFYWENKNEQTNK